MPIAASVSASAAKATSKDVSSRRAALKPPNCESAVVTLATTMPGTRATTCRTVGAMAIGSSRVRSTRSARPYGRGKYGAEILGHRRVLEPLSTHVADNANDHVPVGLARRIGAEALADRILAGKETASECLVDDNGLGDGDAFLVGERAVGDCRRP